MSKLPRLLPAGDAALVVEFGSEIDPKVNQQVHGLSALLSTTQLAGVIEFVPTYRSLLIRYDPLILTYTEMKHWVEAGLPHLETVHAVVSRLVEVPTVYGGASGPDLDNAATTLGLSVDDVVQLHSAVEYRVYMMGFTPGYPYMGKLDARLQLPRLETPRTLVPVGSVAIAGLQTGIYPLTSPGGWHIIGHTDLTLFDLSRDAPFLFAPGDRVRFLPVKQ